MLHQLRRREARRRGAAELTYREIAARTGWSLGIVAQYFTGRSLAPVDRFDALIQLLGASPAEQRALATARDRVDERRRRGSPAHRAAGPDRAAIGILGPVRVAGPAGPAVLVGGRQRGLVAVLALYAGQVVTQSRLVDALWGEQPPRTAVRTLYSHIARVRGALDAAGLPGLLATRGSGYLLLIRPEEVDAGRFAALLARAGRAADPAGAGELLREALDLWRGDALADAGLAGWAAAEADRLQEARLSAYEQLWEAGLRLGEHAAAVPELERLLVAHPTRERLVELLMLARYRCGRHAAALEAYQRLRGHLAEHLGVEPSPRTERTYTAVLRRDPDLDLAEPARRPAQLPPRVGHFTGRTAELRMLDALPDRPALVGVVCGPAGIGKTALAVHWAHRVADRYPDGQLFLDLRGHDPATALPVAAALDHLLRGLDVPAADIPTDPAAQVGLYRTVLHRRRVLVLLDNAASAEQVSCLVPPSAASLALVTSRDRLAGLSLDHAVRTVDLDVLAAAEARTLLGRVVGADRVDREAAQADRLVELCGRLPLALRIAAAKLGSRPAWPVGELVAELTGADRLAGLAVPGDPRGIRAVFASVYGALRPAAARLFRRLGLHPGPTVTAALAAALVGEPGTSDTLEELVRAHVLTEVGAGRYRFHDLIRLYAAERAEPAERAATGTRIVAWYLAVAAAANQVFDPGRDRAGPVTGPPAPFPAEHGAALAYLDAERANLLPVVRYAREHAGEHASAAWRLSYLLTSFQSLRGYWPDQVELCREGLAAAREAGDAAAEALMRSGLGVACNAVGRHDEALAQLAGALRIMRTTGDRRGQGMALNNMAFAYGRLGRHEEAVGAFGEALALHTEDGNPPGVALALNNLGHMHTMLGRADLAVDYLTRALALTREIDRPGLEAATLHSLGEAHRAAAEHGAAIERFAGALAIRRRRGERRLEADTLTLIGLTHRDRGEEGAAATHLRQALAIGRELGDRQLEDRTLAHLRAGAVTAGS